MNKLEIYINLFKEHYLLHFNKKVVVTNKFHREFSLSEMQAATEESLPAVIPTALPAIPAVAYNFKKFILDCEIPEKLQLSNGSFYWANRYSAKADKEFQKVMKRPGIKYDVLVVATKLYYKSGGARVAIGNYMIDGVWESFYDTMEAKAASGAGSVEKHIRKNMSEGDEGFSRYS